MKTLPSQIFDWYPETLPRDIADVLAVMLELDRAEVRALYRLGIRQRAGRYVPRGT